MLSKLFRILILMPVVYWCYLIYSGNLGADPAKSLNHKTGEVSLYLIILNLLFGVLISIQFRFNSKLKFLLTHRRFLGVISFLYLTLHSLLYFVMESFEFKALEQMYSKTYLIFASLAFIILLVLALTSNDFSVKKLKLKNWKRLHKLIYLASLFFSLHILLIEKADLKKFGIVLGVLWFMQAGRFIYKFLYLKKIKSQ